MERGCVSRLVFVLVAALAWFWPLSVQAPAVQARVIRCYDGDTCTVDRDVLPGRNRVRLRNADTAEIEAPCAAEKRLALAAKQFTTSRLVGHVLTLLDVREDKYAGRVDAYIIMPNGDDLGEALISATLGRPYDGGHRASWCADQWR